MPKEITPYAELCFRINFSFGVKIRNFCFHSSRAATKDDVAGQIYRNVVCILYSIKLMALSFPEETCEQFWLKGFKMQQRNNYSFSLRLGDNWCF